MIRQRGNKLGLIAAVGLLTLTLASVPARAGHSTDIVVPVVTAFALGALWQHGHSDHYYRHGYRYERHGYRYERHGYSRHGYGHHGYSRHGYSRKGHYRNGHGHYRQQPRHSSSRGGYHGSRHKH